MKRIALFALGLFAMFGAAFAQTPDIDTPLLALAPNLREGAGVVKWKPDHTYDTLKKSTNNLVCYDRSSKDLNERSTARRSSTSRGSRPLRATSTSPACGPEPVTTVPM